MFFKAPKLPDELILNILTRLSAEEAIAAMRVSKDLLGFIKDDSVWRKFGASDFNDFVIRIKNHPMIKNRS